MTNPHRTLLLAVALVTGGPAAGQTVRPDLTRVAGWKVHNASAATVEMDGKRAVRLKAAGDSSQRIAGLVLTPDVAFTTGTIEVDLKGKNKKQESFLGVAFNVADEKTFEGVYFRPFNFKAEGAFKGRAVQYISWPDNTWEKLRKDKPGVFEQPVNPAPDPDGWFHARVEVEPTKVRVFVDDGKEPTLVVDRLAKGDTARPVGLFVDVSDGLYADLKITPTK